MNWPYLLSEYPRSILSSEFPAMLLALIERGGLMTEEDLQQQLGGKSPELLQTLLDLHQDQLISYGLHHVRLTARGKHVLNALQLGTSIVGDILHDLEVDGASKATLLLVLSDYRERAFEQYLNSVGSIRLWKRIAPAVAEPSEPHTAAFGMCALLIRDIRTFYSQVAPSERITKSLPESFEYLLNQDALAQMQAYNEPLRQLVIRLEGAADAGKRAWKEPESLSMKCLFAFDHFRHKSNAHEWFDRWFEIYPDVQRLIQQHSKQLAERLQELLSLKAGMISPQAKDWQGRRVSAWWRETSSRSLEQDFLNTLMNARSLESLAESLGVSSDRTRQLLSALNQRSAELLAGSSEQLEGSTASQPAPDPSGSSSTPK